MKLIFSRHSETKLRQRNIPKRLVIETAKFPDFTKPSRLFREERYKNFGKNFLKVLVVTETDRTIVITAHWMAKTKKR